MSSTACPEERGVDEYAASGAMCGGVICAHLGTAAQVGHLLAPSAARYDDAGAASITSALPGDQSHRRGVLSAALTGGTFMAAVTACLLVDPVYGLCTSQTHGSSVRRRGRAGGGVSGAALTNLLAGGIILSNIAGARADVLANVVLFPSKQNNVGVVDTTATPYSFSTVAMTKTTSENYGGAVAVGTNVYFAPRSHSNIGVYNTVTRLFSTISDGDTSTSAKYRARGLLRTITRPTLNLLIRLRESV